MDCITAFRDAPQAVYGAMDLDPIADGMIHRFTVPGDRPGSNNGWYVLHAGVIASGAFGSWKIGDCHTWTSREPADQREAHHLRQQMEQARRQREAEQRQRQQATAEYARKLWRDARRADPEHPYLTAKGCRPHALRQLGDALLVPLTHKGELMNVQRIHPDGSKRFLSGGRVKGCCSPLGLIQAGQPLYLCEGWATGATLHENTGHPVACAMNAGNLLAVGQQLQRTYPDALLIVAGDDDRQTEGNPGKTAAITAAATLGCGLILPPWSGDEPLTMTDFNDLRQWQEGKL
ncbi:toprim domain-containing protein [Halopseudomonas aestusnigri]|uniref:DNA primase/helicase n=1 Tax=Halopseudomonas aestusnigri TaxID=857252 RepID=A0AAQ1G7V7_9GAMM|nr:toprim domain-containing protein [Halopseudomonas aestusnigri]OWL88847.1 topoisomerase [Halopseudomonas aestusnigri]SEG35219.1 putative DNA primase/helicase [Halopseudomonas aestusnigri]